jgi:hypothetical protein
MNVHAPTIDCCAILILHPMTRKTVGAAAIRQPNIEFDGVELCGAPLPVPPSHLKSAPLRGAVMTGYGPLRTRGQKR